METAFVNIPGSWQTSVMASCVHAARQIVAGRALNDRRISDALGETAHRLDSALAEVTPGSLASDVCPDPSDRWRLLLELSLDDPSTSDLADRLRRRLGGAASHDDSWETRVSACLSESLADFLRVLPRLTRDLPLRVGPLREQWEARGPGFLARAARLTQLPLATLESRVVLVHPVLGGSGEAHFGAQAIHFEAVLVNQHAKLPETLRLGWLLMQLAAWPWFDAIPEPRRRQLVAAVTLPPAIAAGQYVELAAPEPNLIEAAEAAWLPDSLPPAVAARWAEIEPQPERTWRDAVLALDGLWK